MARTLAVITARAGSKRIPDKNIRSFLGQPLTLWTLDFALTVPFFDRVIVSTDSQHLADLATNRGASVPWLRHPSLATDTASSVDVLLDILHRLPDNQFDRVALLQPTSPVRLIDRWKQAHNLMNDGAPAVLGVRPVDDPPFWTYLLSPDSNLKPCFPEYVTVRSQDLPSAYISNGSLYLVDVPTLLSSKQLVPTGARAVICTEPVESIDIDTELDWASAESLVSDWQNR